MQVKVWDLPTRLFHWSLPLLIIFLWYSAEIADDLMEWHVRAGKLLLSLLVFRLIWGVFGSQTARFSHFFCSPQTIITYLKHLDIKPNGSIGHNPAGAYMVLLMIMVLFVQIFSGLCSSDDIFVEGSFYQYLDEDTADWMAAIHHDNFYVLLVLIGSHLAAIAVYYFKGNNLISPMISGYRKINANISPLYFVHSLWALAIFIAVTLLIFSALK